MSKLISNIYFAAKKYEITLHKTSIKETTEFLIAALYEKYNMTVAILIDEYDEPLLRHLRTPIAEINRDIIADFYKTLKASNEHIHSVFITGVSKFSQLSLFSGANNITDISLDPKYAGVCGYTQADLDTHFQAYLNIVHENYPEYTAEEFKAEVKHRYNGYNWEGEKIYNPFSILQFLRFERFEIFGYKQAMQSF